MSIEDIQISIHSELGWPSSFQE